MSLGSPEDFPLCDCSSFPLQGLAIADDHFGKAIFGKIIWKDDLFGKTLFLKPASWKPVYLLRQRMANIFDHPIFQHPAHAEEFFEVLAAGNGLKIERIISTGQTTPAGEWYDQTQDEWVILLQGNATIAYENGATQALTRGDYVFIPAHQKHRVSYTSTEPPCVWLAIHADLDATPHLG